MALPALLRKLFKSSGYGSELNDGIISKTISNQDWSNSYDYPVGVVARGSDDVLYYSVAQSGPGTSAGAKDPAQGGNSGFWKRIGSGDSVPTGTVLWLSTPTVPVGYLLCDGRTVGRATYPDLFTAIGTTYGAGDGSTTFNLPNLINRFAEGGTVAGTVKNAGLPNITGQIQFRRSDGGNLNNVANYPNTEHSSGALKVNEKTGAKWNNAINTSSGNTAKCDIVNIDASLSSSIYGKSSTVQPPALTLIPCIKAYSSVDNISSLDAAQLENELQNIAGNFTPIGTVIWLSTSSVPAKYLLCNGAAVSRTAYSELFTAIGTTYGAGDGSTTFNLPNLIDKFAEGGTVAGAVKSAGLPNITGVFGDIMANGGYDSHFSINYGTGVFSKFDPHNGWRDGHTPNYNTNGFWNMSFDASRSSSIYGNSDTVQPPAITLLPCIRY